MTDPRYIVTIVVTVTNADTLMTAACMAAADQGAGDIVNTPGDALVFLLDPGSRSDCGFDIDGIEAELED